MKKAIFLSLAACLAVSATSAQAISLFVCNRTSIYTIDSTTGARSILATEGNANGANLNDIGAIETLDSNTLLVANITAPPAITAQIISINLTTQQRTLLVSGNFNPFILMDIDPNGNLYAADADFGAVRMNTSTGVVNQFSFFNIGTGPNLDFARDVLYVNDNLIYAALSTPNVFAIDVTTGNRTDIYSPSPGPLNISSIESESPSSILLVDASSDEIWRWNPSTNIASTLTVSTGPQLVTPRDIAVAQDGTIYILDIDFSTAGVGTVNPVTGIVTPISATGSSWLSGSGVSLNLSSFSYLAVAKQPLSNSTTWNEYQ